MYPLLRLSDSLQIPTYTLVISLTYCVCILLALRRAERLQLSRELTLDLALAIMIGGFLGARLMHVLYENPGYYFALPSEIFKVWQGGFVFFGGLVGALIVSVGLLKIRREPFGPWADMIAPLAALGYALGRVGCFLNGCCYGEFCELPWADRQGRHPTQLYATLWELGVLVALLLIEKRHRLKRAGDLFWLWLLLHGCGRLLMEHFRADDRGSFIAGLSVSTWIALLLILTAIYQLRFKKAK